MKYKRILLKLSGESLAGKQQYGIHENPLISYVGEIKSIVDEGAQIAIVIGGGNIFRGTQSLSAVVERVQGDHMGMLATVINGLALQAALEKNNIPTRLMSALKIDEIAEPFIRRRAIRHLEKNRVVIFAAGTGRPYFSTDTAAVLRAIEINADMVLKATKVDGVYDKDPEKDKSAKLYKKLAYNQVLHDELKVMDTTVIVL